jgi:hypothetical protein
LKDDVREDELPDIHNVGVPVLVASDAKGVALGTSPGEERRDEASTPDLDMTTPPRKWQVRSCISLLAPLSVALLGHADNVSA